MIDDIGEDFVDINNTPCNSVVCTVTGDFVYINNTPCISVVCTVTEGDDIGEDFFFT